MPSPTFSHLLPPSPAFSHLLTPSHARGHGALQDDEWEDDDALPNVSVTDASKLQAEVERARQENLKLNSEVCGPSNA